jgi:integrase
MAGKPFKRGRAWSVVVEPGHDPVTGDRRQKWIRRPTRREVQEEQATLLGECDTGASLDPARLTIAEYLDHWLETVVRPNRSILTAEKYARDCHNQLVPAFGIARLHAYLRSREYARNTLRAIHGCLHAALEMATRWQLNRRNPADLVEVPRRDETPAFIWDVGTLAALLALIPGRRFQPHYLVALNSGMRMGELLGLRWSDIDLARGHLALQRQIIRSTERGYLETQTKGKRARAVTLTADTVAALRVHRVRQAEERMKAEAAWRDEGRVFPNGTGGILSERTIKGDWDGSARRWGLPRMKFHGLHHPYATCLLIAGQHPKVVSERLEHSTPEITMRRYARVSSGLQEGAVSAFEAALKALSGQAGATEGAERGGRVQVLRTPCKRAGCGCARIVAVRPSAREAVSQA